MTTGFATRLNHLLESTTVTQSAIARQSGVSRAAVHKWTKGGQIDDNNLEKLSEIFNVDPVWLKYGVHTGDVSNQSDHDGSIDMVHLNHNDAEVVSWEWDIKTNRVTYSENVKSIYGVCINTNEDFFGLLDPASREEMNKAYERLIQHGGAHEIDFRISTDDGPRWITSRATSIRENNTTTKIVGISLDNTVRKRNEINAAQFETLFKFLLNRCSNITLFTDQHGTIVHSNIPSTNANYLPIKVELERLIYRNIDLINQSIQNHQDEKDGSIVSIDGADYNVSRAGHFLVIVCPQDLFNIQE